MVPKAPAEAAPALARTHDRARPRAWPRRLPRCQRLRRDWVLVLLALPGIVLLLTFRYVPLLGNVITFDIMSNAGLFRELLTSQVIWKDTGWATILFLAAFIVPSGRRTVRGGERPWSARRT